MPSGTLQLRDIKAGRGSQMDEGRSTPMPTSTARVY
jgi:hypothetical protein